MERNVSQSIIAIIAREAVLEPEQVRVDMTLEELGLDSLGLVETIFAIEETFDISVPFNANEPAQSGFDISSVGAIVGAVESLIAAKERSIA